MQRLLSERQHPYPGYGFVSSYKKGERGVYRLRVCPKAFKRMKQKVKEITRKTRPLSFGQRLGELNRFMKGWLNYYRYAHTASKFRDLDSWVRKRLRYCIWHHWKRPYKRKRSLIRLGVEAGQAYAWSRTRMGAWRVARLSHPKNYRNAGTPKTPWLYFLCRTLP